MPDIDFSADAHTIWDMRSFGSQQNMVQENLWLTQRILPRSMNRGGQEQQQEIEFDLSKSPQKAFFHLIKFLDAIGINIKVKNGKKTTETTLAAGKGFECRVTPATVTVNGPNGETVTAMFKEWASKDVPVGGLVKFELDATVSAKQETTKFTMTMTLAGSGKSGS
jgi:hypothetical protein